MPLRPCAIKQRFRWWMLPVVSGADFCCLFWRMQWLEFLDWTVFFLGSTSLEWMKKNCTPKNWYFAKSSAGKKQDAVDNGIDLSSNAFMLIHGWTVPWLGSSVENRWTRWMGRGCGVSPLFFGGQRKYQWTHSSIPRISCFHVAFISSFFEFLHKICSIRWHCRGNKTLTNGCSELNLGTDDFWTCSTVLKFGTWDWQSAQENRLDSTLVHEHLKHEQLHCPAGRFVGRCTNSCHFWSEKWD